MHLLEIDEMRCSPCWSNESWITDVQEAKDIHCKINYPFQRLALKYCSSNKHG